MQHKGGVATALADDLRRSENRTGGVPDRCGLEHEDMLDLMFAFMDGDRRVCRELAGVIRRTRNSDTIDVQLIDAVPTEPPASDEKR
jgi:hypothetical protein